jgi:hypothetical protein
MVVGLCGGLLFLFVPESFWDRTPIPKNRTPRDSSGLFSRYISRKSVHSAKIHVSNPVNDSLDDAKSEPLYGDGQLPEKPRGRTRPGNPK